MNTLQRLNVLQTLFISLQNYALGSCFWPEGEGRPCWSESGAGLGFSSHSAQTPQSQRDRQLAPHQHTLLDHPPVATTSSCFINTCSAPQPQDSARQHPGHGVNPSSPPISPQLWSVPPCPSKILKLPRRHGKQHGAH